MKIQTGLASENIATAADRARSAEDAGYDGVTIAEERHDPFLPLVPAALGTERIEMTTNIAVAFARSPMTVANTAYDLAEVSKGRFTLGLGSQIKPHIEKRFGMPWSKPAARMREYLLALRAIWSCWQDGGRLDYRGEFYRHTLMTPNFTPAAHEYGPPKIKIAAVGPLMTEVAGEVSDGILLHSFTTPEYIRQVTVPSVAAGAQKGGRELKDVEISAVPMVGVLDDDERAPEIISAIRKKLAFYGSTPAYRPVLELHGWGDLQTELHRLSLQGEWDAMGELIGDEQLEAMAIIGSSREVAQRLLDDYDGLAAWVGPYTPGVEVRDLLEVVVAEVAKIRASA
ncbi:TIGR03617 family F420-dependent LLM class oxidoreductase [Cumulibacter soli]|uniref:TIGR03617 family F420-dependent LLM class oxidoreductase n=1 Tax=Cumulibacter soli TaxID=2546344 RepID=UPI0010676566|nr:TIGR03617 family F420-dependent LLM class oxidoreductase [Cumulibacter soli]